MQWRSFSLITYELPDHGTADRILPFEATAARLRDEQLIADLTVVEVDQGPHNIGWTHPDDTNAALLDFLSR